MKKNKPKNLSALAKALGVTRQLIVAHRKKHNAPGLEDVDGWRLFLAEVGREGSAPADLRRKIAEQRLRVVTAVAEKSERENRYAAGEFISRNEVTFGLNKGMALLASTLDRKFKIEAPPALKGRDEVFILTWLTTALTDGYRVLKSEFEKLAKQEH